MRAVVGDGIGIVYWEPAWISTGCRTRWATGSSRKNAALFDNESSNPHKGGDFLSHDYSALPGADELFGASKLAFDKIQSLANK